MAQEGNGSRLDRDIVILFLTRFLRLFAYGLLSVVLVLYLVELGLGAASIGILLTLTLLGDTVISLLLTTQADRLGRRRILIAGALLMVLAAALLGTSEVFVVLVIATTLGVISPSGNEVGPFLPVEQAALAQFVPAASRTRLFAWYNLAGAVATALGSLCAGLIVSAGQDLGLAGAAAYRPLLGLYAALGLVLALLFSRLSRAVEARPGVTAPPVGTTVTRWGLHESRPVVLRLSALFALDAFGGGLVIQSVLAYWLNLRFGAGPAELGMLFLGTNLLSGLSYLAAGWLAQRVGLLNTMVFTHLPANAMLLLVPLMPDFGSVVVLLLLRSLVTQMDVPTRQAYLMAVVSPDERSAAGGITGVARSVGTALSPFLATVWAGSATLAGLPFYLAGTLKMAYDLMLYRGFVHVKPEHEKAGQRPEAGS